MNAYSQFVTYTQLPFAGRPGFANDVTFGNPELRNERAREWELGAEVGLFRGRVGAEATYYDRLVSELGRQLDLAAFAAAWAAGRAMPLAQATAAATEIS